jgi:glycosyltransferase involved in cell wall biosynthesis
MKIGIDVRKIRDTGIGTYIRNLLEAMFEVDERVRYVLFGYPEDRHVIPRPEERIEWVPNRSGKYSVMEHLSLPRQARRHGIDLFHAPHYTLPYFLTCPSIVTIHDLIHLRFPDNLPTRFHSHYARRMAGFAARRAKIVITVSNCSKGDIVSLLDVPEGKVRVIHNGVEDGFFNKPSAGKPGGEDYILAVSSLKPHKNLVGSIRAFSIAADRIPHNLWVTAETPPERSPVRKLIHEEMLEDRIEFLGHLDEEALKKTYTGASALLFLSHYEGFGLPILEAMASGVPVILSRTSSHPEVAGDAAILVEPGDDAYAASAILRMVIGGAERDNYVRKGFERARRFSWKETAAKTLECYREIYEDMSRA